MCKYRDRVFKLYKRPKMASKGQKGDCFCAVILLLTMRCNIVLCIALLTSIILHCIAWYDIVYCLAAPHHGQHHRWCLHQELSTGRADNADKCILHFTTFENTRCPTMYWQWWLMYFTLLYYSYKTWVVLQNWKLINGGIGGGGP